MHQLEKYFSFLSLFIAKIRLSFSFPLLYQQRTSETENEQELQII